MAESVMEMKFEPEDTEMKFEPEDTPSPSSSSTPNFKLEVSDQEVIIKEEEDIDNALRISSATSWPGLMTPSEPQQINVHQINDKIAAGYLPKPRGRPPKRYNKKTLLKEDDLGIEEQEKYIEYLNLMEMKLQEERLQLCRLQSEEFEKESDFEDDAAIDALNKVDAEIVEVGNLEATFDPAVRPPTWTKDNRPPPQVFLGPPAMKVPLPQSLLGFLKLFITRELLEYLTEETNTYAKQQTANNILKKCMWTPVTVKDIAKFLGLTFLTGIVKMRYLSMYWQVGMPWSVAIFNQCMPRQRYFAINSYFHAYNNFAIPKGNFERLVKVRPLVEYFSKKYRDVYVPEREVSIAEGGMPGKGLLRFKVNNPLKPEKHCVNMTIAAEATTGYVSNFEVYSEIGLETRDTVMSLIEHLDGQDCRLGLYNDNKKFMGGVDHYNKTMEYYHFTRRTLSWTKKMTYYLLQMAIHNAFALYKKYGGDRKADLLKFHGAAIKGLVYFDPDEWPYTGDDIPHAPDLPEDEREGGRNEEEEEEEEILTPPMTPEHPQASAAFQAQLLSPLLMQFFAASEVEDPETEEREEDAALGEGPSARKQRIVDHPNRLRRNIDHSLVVIGKRKRCRVCSKTGKRKDTKYKCATCDTPLCPTCTEPYHRRHQYWKT